MRHKVDIFSAGCPACQQTIEMVRKLTGAKHEVQVHDMHEPDVASRATQLGIRSLPAVVIDGKLAGCCAGRGVDERVVGETLH